MLERRFFFGAVNKINFSAFLLLQKKEKNLAQEMRQKRDFENKEYFVCNIAAGSQCDCQW